jgi:hypothetical protein
MPPISDWLPLWISRDPFDLSAYAKRILAGFGNRTATGDRTTENRANTDCPTTDFLKRVLPRPVACRNFLQIGS